MKIRIVTYFMQRKKLRYIGAHQSFQVHWSSSPFHFVHIVKSLWNFVEKFNNVSENIYVYTSQININENFRYLERQLRGERV